MERKHLLYISTHTQTGLQIVSYISAQNINTEETGNQYLIKHEKNK